MGEALDGWYWALPWGGYILHLFPSGDWKGKPLCGKRLVIGRHQCWIQSTARRCPKCEAKAQKMMDDAVLEPEEEGGDG